MISLARHIKEKLKVNKDYKAPIAYDPDDSLMLVKFILKGIVSRDGAVLIDTLTNVNIEQVNPGHNGDGFIISGNETTSKTRWQGRKMNIYDDDSFYYQIVTDSRHNVTAFILLFSVDKTDELLQLMSMTSTNKTYKWDEIFDVLNIIKYVFPDGLKNCKYRIKCFE